MVSSCTFLQAYHKTPAKVDNHAITVGKNELQMFFLSERVTIDVMIPS